MVNRAPKKSFRVVLKGELDDIDGPFCETERDSLFAFPISVVNRLLGKQACSCTGWRSPSRLTRSVYTVAGFHPSTCNQLRYYACSNCFLRRHRPCSLAIERHLYPASSRIFQFETCVLIATSKKTKWKFVNSNSNDSDRMSRILFLWFPFVVVLLCSIRDNVQIVFHLCVITVLVPSPSNVIDIQLPFVVLDSLIWNLCFNM